MITLLPPDLFNTYIFKKIFRDKNDSLKLWKARREKFEYDPKHIIWDKSWKSKAICIWNIKELAFLCPGVRNTEVWV